MAAETSSDKLRAIQDQILALVHRLDRILTRLRRLQGEIDLGDDAAMVEGDEPPSLAFELHGVIELASDTIAQAADLLRRAAVETEESLRLEFLRPDKPRGGIPASKAAAETARRASGNGSPDDEEG